MVTFYFNRNNLINTRFVSRILSKKRRVLKLLFLAGDCASRQPSLFKSKKHSHVHSSPRSLILSRSCNIKLPTVSKMTELLYATILTLVWGLDESHGALDRHGKIMRIWLPRHITKKLSFFSHVFSYCIVHDIMFLIYVVWN